MDFILDFICGYYGIPYEIHLIPYERPGESEESHFNQLFLLFSGGFHVNSTRFQVDFMKSTRFQL